MSPHTSVAVSHGSVAVEHERRPVLSTERRLSVAVAQCKSVAHRHRVAVAHIGASPFAGECSFSYKEIYAPAQVIDIKERVT